MTTMMFAVLLALTGCVEDVGTDKVAATVTDVPAADAVPTEVAPTEAAPTEAAPVAGTALAVVKDQSSIRALGAKITATHPIDFKDFEGSVNVDGGKVVGLAFTAQIATLQSDHPKLTEHLITPDFFDAAQFPTATFKSVSITERATGEGMTHTVAGDLTVRGMTKRVTFPATLTVTGDKVEAKTEFVLNRQDFGVTYAGKADDLIQDNVVLTVALVAGAGV